MLIPCVRCGKLIDSPNTANAKYIMNPADKKTWGKDKVGRFRTVNPISVHIGKHHKHFDEAITEMNTRRNDWDTQIENLPPEAEEAKAILIAKRDGEAVQEVFIEEERPKTAIVCLDCVKPNDTVIW